MLAEKFIFSVIVDGRQGNLGHCWVTMSTFKPMENHIPPSRPFDCAQLFLAPKSAIFGLVTT